MKTLTRRPTWKKWLAKRRYVCTAATSATSLGLDTLSLQDLARLNLSNDRLRDEESLSPTFMSVMKGATPLPPQLHIGAAAAEAVKFGTQTLNKTLVSLAEKHNDSSLLPPSLPSPPDSPLDGDSPSSLPSNGTKELRFKRSDINRRRVNRATGTFGHTSSISGQPSPIGEVSESKESAPSEVDYSSEATTRSPKPMSDVISPPETSPIEEESPGTAMEEEEFPADLTFGERNAAACLVVNKALKVVVSRITRSQPRIRHQSGSLLLRFVPLETQLPEDEYLFTATASSTSLPTLEGSRDGLPHPGASDGEPAPSVGLDLSRNSSADGSLATLGSVTGSGIHPGLTGVDWDTYSDLETEVSAVAACVVRKTSATFVIVLPQSPARATEAASFATAQATKQALRLAIIQCLTATSSLPTPRPLPPSPKVDEESDDEEGSDSLKVLSSLTGPTTMDLTLSDAQAILRQYEFDNGDDADTYNDDSGDEAVGMEVDPGTPRSTEQPHTPSSLTDGGSATPTLEDDAEPQGLWKPKPRPLGCFNSHPQPCSVFANGSLGFCINRSH